MTVQQLIKKLMVLPSQAHVEAWDYEEEEFGEVIDVTWDDGGKSVLLIADATKKARSD